MDGKMSIWVSNKKSFLILRTFKYNLLILLFNFIFTIVSCNNFDINNYELQDGLIVTDDAIIIEAPVRRRWTRSAYIDDRNNTAEIISSVSSSRGGRQFIGWPANIIPTGPCITSVGKLGRCTSLRACYPYQRIPSLNNFEHLFFRGYDTCSYFQSNGEQAFGVCCASQGQQRPSYPSPDGTTYSPFATKQPGNPIPPNWPPPVPTHPPDHTIPPLPTHPPAAGHPTTQKPHWPPAAPTHPTTVGHWPPPTQQPQWPPSLPTHPTTVGHWPPTTTAAWPPPTQQPQWPPPTQQPWPPAWPPTQRPTTQPPWPPTQRPTTQQPWPPTTTPPPWAQKPTPVPPVPPQHDNEITDSSCGAKNDQERIVGGQEAGVGEWPWIAALFNSGRQFCGGSLIDNQHILTAAHCVAHMSSWDVARMTVRLGEHNIRTLSDTRHIEKKVKRIVRHKGFDPRTLYNDVAVLTLDSPVTFTRQVRPICLPIGGHSDYSGQHSTVIGWGSLRESGAQSHILQEVNIPIWTNQRCKQKYGLAAPGGIIDSFLCAGEPDRDSCSGDSGGPLMVDQGKWTQVGIVSWGIGCGKGQYPGVYSRVTHFMPWITKNSKQ